MSPRAAVPTADPVSGAAAGNSLLRKGSESRSRTSPAGSKCRTNIHGASSKASSSAMGTVASPTASSMPSSSSKMPTLRNCCRESKGTMMSASKLQSTWSWESPLAAPLATALTHAVFAEFSASEPM